MPTSAIPAITASKPIHVFSTTAFVFSSRQTGSLVASLVSHIVPMSEPEDSSLTEIDWLAQIQSTQPPSSAYTADQTMSKLEAESTALEENRKPRHR